jgi:tRNA U38,U39,U40 pseudouridine synthase TruA
VSAVGQVVGIRLRSKARRFAAPPAAAAGATAAAATPVEAAGQAGAASLPTTSAGDTPAGVPPPHHVPHGALWVRLDPATGEPVPNGCGPGEGEPFPPPPEEHDYAATLNSLLPADIRVLGWTDVPDNFSARFSCTGRVYRYYFPARGLDLPAMRAAAALLQGTHDFRNVARIDITNTQNFVRALSSLRIVKVEERAPAARRASACAAPAARAACRELLLESHSVPPVLANRVAPHGEGDRGGGGAASAAGEQHHPEPALRIVNLLRGEHTAAVHAADAAHAAPAPEALYYLQVTGNAFLWHQVRCLVSLLFHVGRGFELPDVAAWLLDVTACPAKPQYPMAPDAPLVLYHCSFGEEGPESHYRDHPASSAGMTVEMAAGRAPSPPPAANASSASSPDAAPPPADDAATHPSPRSSLIDSSLYRPTRFARSFSSLYDRMYHSPHALRKMTLELEGMASDLHVRSTMLRALLDRVYTLHVDEAEVRRFVYGAKSGGSSLPSSTITWAAAVAKYSAAAARFDAAITKPLVCLEDAEMFIHGIPSTERGGARGGYTPFRKRLTGFSVEKKWGVLSDAERTKVAHMHPVNAGKLTAGFLAQEAKRAI